MVCFLKIFCFRNSFINRAGLIQQTGQEHATQLLLKVINEQVRHILASPHTTRSKYCTLFTRKLIWLSQNYDVFNVARFRTCFGFTHFRNMFLFLYFMIFIFFCVFYIELVCIAFKIPQELHCFKRSLLYTYIC